MSSGAPAPSMQTLFDDDSSDEDGDTLLETQPPPCANTSAMSGEKEQEKPEPAEEDAQQPKNEVSNSDNNENDKDNGESQSNVEEKGENNDNDENEATDDNKDDDAEFEDDDIVGSKAPHPRPPSASVVESTTEDDHGLSSVQKQPRLQLKPHKLRVVNVEHPKDRTLHMTKLPNVVGINPEAFDPDTFSAALEEEEYRGYVHNMIRWRYKQNPTTGDYERDANGKLLRESNARIVKWNDGSYTLHVGRESFEIDDINSALRPNFAGLNGYLYLSQKASKVDDDGEPTPGGTVLECMGAISSKIIPRPSSLQSEAHKTLTLAVRQRNMKKARIAEYVTQVDPEKEKSDRIKNKEDLEKQERRRGGARRSYTPSRRTPGMNRRYMEENDGAYDSVNIGSIKRGTMEGADDMDDYGDDDSEDEWSRRKLARGGPPKGAGRDDHESSEDDVVFESSDEEANVRVGKKRPHQALVDDDDD